MEDKETRVGATTVVARYTIPWKGEGIHVSVIQDRYSGSSCSKAGELDSKSDWESSILSGSAKDEQGNA